MLKTIMALLVVSGVLSAGLPAARAEGGETQVEMTMRLDREYRAADRELNAAYRKLMAWLGEDSPTRQELIKSEKAWLQYRDHYAEVECSTMRGGSGENAARLFALVNLTRNRTKEMLELCSSAR